MTLSIKILIISEKSIEFHVKKKSLFLFLSCCFSYTLFASNPIYKIKSDTSNVKKNATNLYMEIVGQSFMYSLNYEKLLLQKNRPHALRAGISYYQQLSFGHEAPIHSIFVPFAYSALFGKRYNYLEAGIGITYNNFFQVGEATITNVLGNLVFGYRRQAEKGVLFRITYTPFIYIFSNDYNLNRSDFVFGIVGHPIWFGLSIGYTFFKN
ncbi:MAG: hypothetical protein Kow0079_17830 [Vicingaceae bacterium]